MSKSFFLLSLAVLALSLISLRAGAVDCPSLSRPVYVTGSTAAKPLLAEIGKYMASLTPAISVVYLGQGSCTGTDAILNGTPIKGSGTTALSTWDTSGTEGKCDIPIATHIQADIGISDVFATTCFNLPGGLPSNMGDFLGPVQAMVFITPKSSKEKSISAEAGYYVYGFGNASGVAPWTDKTKLFKRDEQSGTQRMIAAAIGVPAEKWKGTATTGSTDLLKKLTATGVDEGGLGILAADVAEDNRAILNVLAYQHTGQACGYYPNRDLGSNEKINVRDGHYAIWGALHLFTRLDSNGFPLKKEASDVIGYLAGTKAAPNSLDLIYLEAQRHVVPQCAMRVKRTQEMGSLLSFSPPGACGCYYEKAANGSTACQPCSKNADCSKNRPLCSYGFCEPN